MLCLVVLPVIRREFLTGSNISRRKKSLTPIRRHHVGRIRMIQKIGFIDSIDAVARHIKYSILEGAEIPHQSLGFFRSVISIEFRLRYPKYVRLRIAVLEGVGTLGDGAYGHYPHAMSSGREPAIDLSESSKKFFLIHFPTITVLLLSMYW